MWVQLVKSLCWSTSIWAEPGIVIMGIQKGMPMIGTNGVDFLLATIEKHQDLPSPGEE
jgi:hypothetical protein